MLERLHVKNIALIEEADIQFDGALNVLSGETGAGKSVILDSINFVLGSKADKSMIRYGTDEASVRAEFKVKPTDTVISVLQEMDIEADDAIIISRKYSVDGKGGIKVNGNAVTSAMLKKISSHLVDVHGQSEHFFLLNEVNQLTVVDSLCGKIISLKEQLATHLANKRQLKEKISLLGGSDAERMQRLDVLSYQINEIEAADISVGELDKLIAKKKIFDNAERILASINAIKDILSEDNGCVDLLSMAKRHASTISDIDDEYADIYNRLENLLIESSDLSETISDIADSFSFDAQEAERIEDRISQIKNLIKKYGVDEESVLEFLDKAKEQYSALEDAAVELEKINKQITDLNRDIFETCKKITDARKSTCDGFCKNVEEQLKSLNIPNAKFYVEFCDYDEENISASANGADKICFMFSANKGEPAKPLSKVISGGEMSRFMLAIKAILKDINGISTYIFDEIDAGISGVTALSVAEKFVTISKNTQIIAVSHLPQVCAAATAQFLISKSDGASGKTLTNIKKLNASERVDEIVRLTGSISTDAARVHAKELLAKYGN